MRSRPVVPMVLFLAVVVAGCGDTDVASGSGPSPSAAGSASSTPESEQAPHSHSHSHGDVPVEVSLTPTCVTPGGTVTVTVQTAPRAGVLYLAHYSDGASGAEEPIGAGYGGNGGGYADADGRFEESWTVSTQAPVGPGRLEVVTASGHRGEDTTFDVADPDTGGC